MCKFGRLRAFVVAVVALALHSQVLALPSFATPAFVLKPSNGRAHPVHVPGKWLIRWADAHASAASVTSALNRRLGSGAHFSVERLGAGWWALHVRPAGTAQSADSIHSLIAGLAQITGVSHDDYIQPQEVPQLRVSLVPSRPGVEVSSSSGTLVTQVQDSAPWQLDRLDQEDGLDGHYHYDTTGRGVTAYVADTGINLGHSEFQGRVNRWYWTKPGNQGYDCGWHGTAVASVLGGATAGVAKSVEIVPIRIYGTDSWTGEACTGTTASMVQGIEAAINDHAQHPGPAVLNLSSLIHGHSQPVDDAIAAAEAAGIVVTVSAGNDHHDACEYSPADAPTAIVVAASTPTDTAADSSNYGQCVSLYAPGTDINVATSSCAWCFATASGTSFAAPLVAGLAARWLEFSPDLNPAEIREVIRAWATPLESLPVSATDSNLLAALTPLAPYEPPKDVVAQSESSGIRVSWSQSEQHGGTLSDGTVYGDATQFLVEAAPGASSCITNGLTCTLSKVTPGVDYSVTVTAVNSFGQSQTSVPLMVRAATVPSAPGPTTAVAGDSWAVVSWVAPVDDGGSPVTGYTVQSSPGGFSCVTVSLSCTVTGLSNGTSYTFTVVADNAVGSSLASPSSEPVTPAIVRPGTTWLVRDTSLWLAPGSGSYLFEAIGAGGSGGTGQIGWSAGGGGGGGAFASGISLLTAASRVQVTVGAGGASTAALRDIGLGCDATVGRRGGDSSVTLPDGSTLTSGGGSGGGSYSLWYVLPFYSVQEVVCAGGAGGTASQSGTGFDFPRGFDGGRGASPSVSVGFGDGFHMGGQGGGAGNSSGRGGNGSPVMCSLSENAGTGSMPSGTGGQGYAGGYGAHAICSNFSDQDPHAGLIYGGGGGGGKELSPGGAGAPGLVRITYLGSRRATVPGAPVGVVGVRGNASV
ncbi:MAG: S8 family serine peptidase, partial [Actinomycetales bacterium]|nr:S8 family serine peptidase [Actinomycetales bacterium]